MNIIDISNWTIDEINNSIDTFKDTSLTDIGMVNCDIESINIVGEVTTATLWINEDIGINGYTGTAPLKIYKEDKIEIKLNSPLLKGDTIEVKDSKLCHVHRWEKIVLDGSEDWTHYASGDITSVFCLKTWKGKLVEGINFYCNRFPCIYGSWNVNNSREGTQIDADIALTIQINNNKLSTQDVNGFKQWLQQNPTTVVYELVEPYYEDITPLQSSIILKTFLESSMIINTNLPIKTNVSYRTNVPSISTLSNRVAEVSESDNVIHNLINIIDDEVDE